MRKLYIALIGASMVAACGRRDNDQLALDTTRSIQIPVPDSSVALNDAPANKTDTVYLPQPTPPRVTPRPAAPRATRPSTPRATPPAPPPAPALRTVAAGTVVETRNTTALSSRTNKAGETFTATVDEAVTTPGGRVVIPAGAEVTFTIVALKPAENKSQKDGTITLRATSVLVNGQSMPIDADVTYVEHTLKGRGIGTSEAAKVGGGAAAGAIIGKVIGGGTGAVVGGVVGGAAGGAVAVETADRDVIIPVGAKIRLALRSEFPAA